MKKCPYCEKEILENSAICPMCRHTIEEASMLIKAPVQISGAIKGDTIEFDPPVIIQGIEYGSFQFDFKGTNQIW